MYYLCTWFVGGDLCALGKMGRSYFSKENAMQKRISKTRALTRSTKKSHSKKQRSFLEITNTK